MSSVGDHIDIRGFGRREEDGRLDSGDYAYLMKRVPKPSLKPWEKRLLVADIVGDLIVVWGGPHHKALGFAIRNLFQHGRPYVEVHLRDTGREHILARD